MKTNEARKRTQQALEQLNDALRAGKSDRLVAHLKAMAHFHRYSSTNQLLIMSQRPDATRIAGFRAWQKRGRHIKRGEKGIAIVVPITISADRNTDAEIDDDAATETAIRYRVGYVFDISQTEGKSQPQLATAAGDPGDHMARIKDLITSRGIAIEESAQMSAHGRSLGGRILINSKLSPADTFATLVHEYAHECMHQGHRHDRPSKTVLETEAEAVAAVVCQAIGLDGLDASSDYIQLYQGTSETLAHSLGRIQSLAQKVIEYLK